MNRRNEERESLIIASLLHDIGKFAQRAGDSVKDEENLIEEYCKEGPHSPPSHFHVIFSKRYIDEFLGDSRASEFAAGHHFPRQDNFGQNLIQLADWLSSGERRDRPSEEETRPVKEIPLKSIFSLVKLNGKEGKELYFPPVKVGSPLKDYYPREKSEINAPQGFRELWENFKEESKYLLKDSPFFLLLLSRILHLLEKYTLFIPSAAYREEPEISLFHHLKSTCAIATVLYDVSKSSKVKGGFLEEITRVKESIRQERWDAQELRKERFILLAGDISGIQDFIYSVTSEGALKGLRGRSLYLELLSEVIARKILDEFNLTPCNILHLGGGNFSLLLPNLEDTEEILERLKKDISQRIFEAHRGKLSLILGYLPFSYWYFMKGNFKQVVERLRVVLAMEKRRKFKEIMDGKFFSPYPADIDKKQRACEICGREIEREGKCNLCESFEELARKISKARYIKIKEKAFTPLTGEVDRWFRLIGSLGYECRFEESPGKESLILNSTDFLNEGLAGFKFHPIYVPVNREGDTLTLEDISKRAKGIKKWGILRMDVDNLGKIFTEGLGEYHTISRYSMLSYMLSLFFSQGVREIVEKDFKNANIIYSGGDDLFIIAPWNELPELGREIYQNFRKFTGSHPALTLSGAFFIAPSPKYPVYQGAIQTGEMEEEAKKGDKDALNFLGMVVEWQEFGELEEIKNYIVALLNPGNGKKFPRAFLSLLYSAITEKEKLQRIWVFLYNLKRLVDRYISSEEERLKMVQELRDKFVRNYRMKENLLIPVVWADYLTREKEGGA